MAKGTNDDLSAHDPYKGSLSGAFDELREAWREVILAIQDAWRPFVTALVRAPSCSIEEHRDMSALNERMAYREGIDCGLRLGLQPFSIPPLDPLDMNVATLSNATRTVHTAYEGVRHSDDDIKLSAMDRALYMVKPCGSSSESWLLKFGDRKAFVVVVGYIAPGFRPELVYRAVEEMAEV